MINKIKILAIMLFFILSLAGCGASLSGDGGVEPTEVLDLDGQYESKVSIEKEEIVALDVRIPKKSGYDLVGASFDPEVLQLVHYLTYEDDGQPRAQYMFQAMEDGGTTVLIKMQPLGGGNVEVYKQVVVTIGTDRGLF